MFPHWSMPYGNLISLKSASSHKSLRNKQKRAIFSEDVTSSPRGQIQPVVTLLGKELASMQCEVSALVLQILSAVLSPSPQGRHLLARPEVRIQRCQVLQGATSCRLLDTNV